MKVPSFNPDWPDDVKALYRHDMQEIWDPSIAPHIWNQYHNQLEIYLSLTAKLSGLRILDVGCAQATLALLLAERGHRVTAMDIRQQFLDYAMSRYENGDIDFVCGNALDHDFQEEFDLVFANQVIEHLVYPLDFIRSMAGWLKPGGRLVMTTPNAGYLKISLPSYSELGDVTSYEHLQFSADGDGHFFAFSGEELTGLFTKAGLGEVTMRYFETPWISGHMKVRYLHRCISPALLRSLDRLTLRIPGICRTMAHQLIVSGVVP